MAAFVVFMSEQDCRLSNKPVLAASSFSLTCSVFHKSLFFAFSYYD